MEMALLILAGILLPVILTMNIIILWRMDLRHSPFDTRITGLEASLSRIENNLTRLEAAFSGMGNGMREEYRINREENARTGLDNRTELNNALREIRTGMLESLTKLTEQNHQAFQGINKIIADRLESLADRIAETNKANRDEQSRNLKEFAAEQGRKTDELVKTTESRLETIRSTVEEKLEKTLSERLGQSFETVGRQLIEVQKGLGEMQTIATDVGGLKKVLGNVKLRGGVGEVQLAMLLEQILAPGQYEANVRTKKGSADPVEFAIKLPGRSEEENDFVYLPVDAKFPKDTYEKLIEAYENAIPDDIEEASLKLESTIKKMARDIRDKYIDPPNTTEFAIMFLPFESIYAEVIRRSPLVDQLRDEFKITVAGPTTLMAILNSLQMGFRTLALQKRSSEVWRVLSSVKTEFDKFGSLLSKAQNNIQTGLGQLDNVVGARTRAIQRHLKNVEALPAPGSGNMLPSLSGPSMTDSDEEEE